MIKIKEKTHLAISIAIIALSSWLQTVQVQNFKTSFSTNKICCLTKGRDGGKEKIRVIFYNYLPSQKQLEEVRNGGKEEKGVSE